MAVGKNDNDIDRAETDEAQRARWLTLKDASAFLGVHYTTVRNWADKGEIRVFRTPGGHRRFSVEDLRAFLEERVSHTEMVDSTEMVEAAVVRVRKEIQSIPQDEMSWRYALDEGEGDVHRARGRQLFSLAISFVLKPNQRQRILNEGRSLGETYGRDAARNDVGLRDTGKAVQFFRGQLTQLLRQSENPRVLDAEDVRVRQLLDQFLDEVLFAVLDGYEKQVSMDSAIVEDAQDASQSHL
jgi:excisionase family DNA binding protein